jgi:tubulin-folding cofactor B
MAALHTAGDIPLLIKSDNASSERRVSPGWSIGQLKAKLEAVTGIPPLSQKLVLQLNQQAVTIEAADEESTTLINFPLTPYAEIQVSAVTWLIIVSHRRHSDLS